MVGLTPYGKLPIDDHMWRRGLEFLAASVLLQKHSGYSFASVQLMCQGIEVSLKALLVYKDKSKYGPKLRTKYGHDLVKLAEEVLRVYSLKPMRPAVRDELAFLSKLYATHFLRYGDARDLFFDAGSIQDTHLIPRLVAAMRLAQRELYRP